MRRSTDYSLMIFSLLFIMIIGHLSPLHALCIGVGCTCSVSSSGLNFGYYNPTNSSALLMNSNIVVSCTAAAINARIGYTVSLSTGLSNTYTLRTMSNGQQSLNYNIYIDNAYTQVAGNGASASSTISDNYLITQILTAYSISYPVYGMIFPFQKVTAGNYSDSIVLTVSF